MRASSLLALLSLALVPTLARAQDDVAEHDTESSPEVTAEVTAEADVDEVSPRAESIPDPTRAAALEASRSGVQSEGRAAAAATEPLAAEPLAAEPEAAEPEAAEPAAEDEFGIRATAELGFLGVLSHTIRLGRDGTEIDYITDGEQSNLYLFLRLSAELDIWRQHHIIFLYQPLDITTQQVLARDLRIDGLDFPQGTPVRFRYGFPFYRFSWDFDVLDDPREQLRFGLGLQIRDATIEFESLDGTLYRNRANVGPVPLLRVAGRFPIVDDFFFAFEADGLYAPISVLNGSDNEVQGAILDASIRVGWRFFEHVEGFLNVRYLAGGASGSGSPTPTSPDGDQANWLHFLTVSLGATFDSRP